MTDYKYVCNAFSLQMVNAEDYDMKVRAISEEEFNNIKSVTPSAVGHADTANVLGVAMNRVSVTLDKGDKIVVAQLVGGRLPEGSTTLPNGFAFKYKVVEIV